MRCGRSDMRCGRSDMRCGRNDMRYSGSLRMCNVMATRYRPIGSFDQLWDY